MIDIITKYFPGLTDLQCQQYEMLDALYRDWNSKINVISRKDINNLYEHHVLHSLAMTNACSGNAPKIAIAERPSSTINWA